MPARKPRRKSQAEVWLAHVRRVSNGDSQAQIVRVTGIDQAVVSRWHKPGIERKVTIDQVRKFAHGYGVSFLETAVAAGLLTEDDAESQIVDWTSADPQVVLRWLADQFQPGAVA
jgi:transcriptional regulator with XRE-family HTH domain